MCFPVVRQPRFGYIIPMTLQFVALEKANMQLRTIAVLALPWVEILRIAWLMLLPFSSRNAGSVLLYDTRLPVGHCRIYQCILSWYCSVQSRNRKCAWVADAPAERRISFLARESSFSISAAPGRPRDLQFSQVLMVALRRAQALTSTWLTRWP